MLGLDVKRGLSNVLCGTATLAEMVQHLVVDGQTVPHLDVLCAGARLASPGEVLGSPAMRELVDGARKSYDWVIFDTPPVLFVSDSSIVSAHCDGVVLVVRAGKHNRSVITRAMDHLREIRVTILGSVLNMMVSSRFGRYFSDYSYHGYSKYARDYQKSYYSSPDSENKAGEKEDGQPGARKP